MNVSCVWAYRFAEPLEEPSAKAMPIRIRGAVEYVTQ